MIDALIWAACLESDKYGLRENARFVNFSNIFLFKNTICLFFSILKIWLCISNYRIISACDRRFSFLSDRMIVVGGVSAAIKTPELVFFNKMTCNLQSVISLRIFISSAGVIGFSKNEPFGVLFIKRSVQVSWSSHSSSNSSSCDMTKNQLWNLKQSARRARSFSSSRARMQKCRIKN